MFRRALVSILLMTAACGDTGGTGGAGGTTSTGGAGGTVPSPYACTGACDCDDDRALCTCHGDSTCATTCDQPCNVACDGTSKCDVTCQDGCVLDCPGSGCLAHVGLNAKVSCGPKGICEVFCAGDCTLDCPDSALCLVHCTPGATCTISNCDAPQTCPKDVSTCRTNCPPMTG